MQLIPYVTSTENKKNPQRETPKKGSKNGESQFWAKKIESLSETQNKESTNKDKKH